MNDRPRRPLAGRLPFANAGIGPGDIGRRHKPDYWILIFGSMLLVIGLVVVYSISPGLSAAQNVSQSYFITKQLIDVTLGLTAFAVAAYLPTSWWWRMATPLAITAIIASIIVMIMPVDALHQAHRWIRVGNFSFQVVELIKLALLVWTARFLTVQWRAGKLGDFKATLRPLMVIALAVGLVVASFQSDLGSAGVIVAVVGLMAFVVGIPLKKIGIIFGLIAVMAVLAIATSPYRRDRLSTFLNPQANCEDSGYQACQALVSVGSGGLFGLGLGHSVQAYGYLPEAGNDSIFAIMAEKFGFIGSISILFLYGALVYRLKMLVERTSNQFNRLLVVGVLAWLSTQIIINTGAMIGLLPLKGITLPYVSQGGTSLIFLTAALGLVFQISRYTNYSKTEPKVSFSESNSNQNSIDRRGLRRPHNPTLVARPRS